MNIQSFLNIHYHNKVLIFTQLILLFLQFNYPYINILFIYLIMIELIINLKHIENGYGKNLKFFIIYLFIKFCLLFLMFIYYPNYEAIFLITIFQIAIFFFNKDTLLIYKDRKINSFLSILILTMLITYVIYFNYSFWSLFLIYPIITIILLHIKAIKTNNKFCTNDKTLNPFLLYLQRIPLSFLILVGILFIGFFNLISLNIINISVIILLSLLTILYERKQYIYAKKHKVVFYIYYILPFILLFTIVSLSWLVDIKIDKNDYTTYLSSTFNTITNISILNIASLFIILQLNYNKFGSSYLLFQIIKSPILLIITFTPAIIMLSFAYIIGTTSKSFDAVPTLLLLISYISTFLLFIYTYFFMETNFLMKRLFKKVKYDDFKMYKKNIINENETNIDTILLIITKVINNNDSNASHSLFFNLFCWINFNISNINEHNSGPTRQNNKFYDFFKTIITDIVHTNNNVIHNNFILAIQKMIIININSNNYTNYKIIYMFLFDYLKLTLEHKNLSVSNSIYRLIYSRCSTILIEQKHFNLTNYEMIDYRENSEYSIMSNFKGIFIEPLAETIKLAITHNQIDFLSYRNFYDDIFIGILSLRDEYDYSKWDGKIFDIFNDLRRIRHNSDRFVIDNEKFWSSYINDYSNLFPYGRFHNDKKNNYIYESVLQSYVFFELKNIYLYAINNNKITSDFDFEIFWQQIHQTIHTRDTKVFKEFTSIFTFLFEKLCETYLHKENNDDIVLSVFLRVTQIQSFKELNEECKNFIDSKISILENKYPRLVELNSIPKQRKLINNIDTLKDYTIS